MNDPKGCGWTDCRLAHCAGGFCSKDYKRVRALGFEPSKDAPLSAEIIATLPERWAAHTVETARAQSEAARARGFGRSKERGERTATTLTRPSRQGPGPDVKCPSCDRVIREILGEAPTAVEVDGVWGCADCYDSDKWPPSKVRPVGGAVITKSPEVLADNVVVAQPSVRETVVCLDAAQANAVRKALELPKVGEGERRRNELLTVHVPPALLDRMLALGIAANDENPIAWLVAKLEGSRASNQVASDIDTEVREALSVALGEDWRSGRAVVEGIEKLASQLTLAEHERGTPENVHTLPRPPLGGEIDCGRANQLGYKGEGTVAEWLLLRAEMADVLDAQLRELTGAVVRACDLGEGSYNIRDLIAEVARLGRASEPRDIGSAAVAKWVISRSLKRMIGLCYGTALDEAKHLALVIEAVAFGEVPS